VYVEDINDNAPTFTNDHYETRTTEASLIGTNIIQVSATDKDWDKKGKVSYNITNGDPQGLNSVRSLFVIKNAIHNHS